MAGVGVETSAPVLLATSDVDVAEALSGDLALFPWLARVGSIEAAVRAIYRAPRVVALLDVSLGEDGVMEVVHRARGAKRMPEWVFFGALAAPQLTWRIAELGATYLGRDESVAELAGALRRVTLQRLAKREGTEQHKQLVADELAKRTALTPRERDVLREIARGCDRSEIAAALGITINTTKHRLDQVFDKTERITRTRTIAGLYAWICDEAHYQAYEGRTR